MPLVGVVPKGTNHTFWQSVHAGAIKAGEEFNLEILWNAPQMEIDAARQISIVETSSPDRSTESCSPPSTRTRWSRSSSAPPTAAFR